MTALPAFEEGVRSRTISWTDPARARFSLRDRDGLEQLRAVARGAAAPPPAAALLGMQIDSVDRGRVVFAIVADEMHENPMGTMHGGIIATLVDSAMGCAVLSMLPAGTGYTTLELKTNYVRPIVQTTGSVRAEGRVVHLGGTVATAEATVKDENGTLYAHASSTCLIKRPPGRAS
ncbi:MAG: PaaI family thioesterase [Acidimicrobiia bacterium]